MYMSRSEIERWADLHSTSLPIARAIIETARDEHHAQAIWEGDAATAAIMVRAWELADPEDDHMFWGECREDRPAAVYGRVTVEAADEAEALQKVEDMDLSVEQMLADGYDDIAIYPAELVEAPTALPRFIIGFGWDSDVDLIEAPNLDEARMIAAKRSMGCGLLDDDLADTTWAEPYSHDLALEVGLLTIDEDNPRWGRLYTPDGGENITFDP